MHLEILWLPKVLVTLSDLTTPVQIETLRLVNKASRAGPHLAKSISKPFPVPQMG